MRNGLVFGRNSAANKMVANEGPKAIAVAVEVAAKASKRRDSFAKELADLGVVLKVSWGLLSKKKLLPHYPRPERPIWLAILPWRKASED